MGIESPRANLASRFQQLLQLKLCRRSKVQFAGCLRLPQISRFPFHPWWFWFASPDRLHTQFSCRLAYLPHRRIRSSWVNILSKDCLSPVVLLFRSFLRSEASSRKRCRPNLLKWSLNRHPSNGCISQRSSEPCKSCLEGSRQWKTYKHGSGFNERMQRDVLRSKTWFLCSPWWQSRGRTLGSFKARSSFWLCL